MLKAYALALALATSTPTTDNAQEEVKAPIDSKPVATEAQYPWKR